MHRPHTALQQLRAAADAPDLQLDRALRDVGVLPPLELVDIRTILRRDRTELLLARNRDGHAIVQIVVDGQLTAQIHPDGRVQHLTTVAA